MTNFDFLHSDPKFSDFADTAVAAERIYAIDPSASVVNCRRAMEYAVKWMYSVDGSLVMPWDDKLVSLMNTDEFRDVVDSDILRRMDFIRRIGNIAAHEGKKITKDQAQLCLQHLYSFMDFVAYCYADQYTEGKYNPALLVEQPPVTPAPSPEKDIRIEELLKENAALRDELTARREEQQQTYVPKPLDISEYKTRKAYIDYMLMDAGWTEGTDWLNEVELQGMPNTSGVGYADYVLYGSDGRALAVIEAKRSCVDVSKGRQQAKLYADLFEAKQGRRPVVFLTNGFETRIIDNQYTHHCRSPLGEILLAADDMGLTGLWFTEGQKYMGLGLSAAAGERDMPVFCDAERWLDIYFSGRDPGFTPALHLVGTAFRNRVGEIMLGIPYGKTMTYGEIAWIIANERGIGHMSSQAVGGAVGKNPISLIIPCHRVIGSDGSLTGYGGGLERKAALLKLERRLD